MREVNKKKLAESNGKEGRAAYVAVDDKVYDMSASSLWKEGEHMGQHAAGQDLTEALAGAPHGKEMLDRVQQVGVYKKDAAPAVKPPPDWALKLLSLHPHPVSVHFPQAAFTFAPVFLILFYIFDNPHFERTAFYLLIAGWITSIPAIKTGIFHWIYKHGKSTKGLYTFKLVTSAVLFIYGAVVIYLHATAGVLSPESIDFLMVILYLLLLPIIMSIGHGGGKIVFG